MSIRRTVRKVIDGDTIEVNRKIDGTNRVRLEGVNAPELPGQRGRKAQNQLKGLIGGDRVTLSVVATDKYNRKVATVRKGRRNINKAMRDRGY